MEEKMERDIEKGIPMPEPKRRGKWEELIKKMKVGDSVTVDSITQAQIMHAAANRNNAKVTVRREGGGYRVWRFK
jgi:hypothetical protein